MTEPIKHRKGVGVAGIVARLTPALLKLQQELIAAVAPFAFSPAGAAVYQLGPFGTAAKKLKVWELQP